MGPAAATIIWFSITFSHRQEKDIVIKGILWNIAFADITNDSTALIGAAYSGNQQQRQLAKSSLKTPFQTAFDPKAKTTDPSGTTKQSTLQSSSNTHESMDRLASHGSSIGRSPSEQQGDELLSHQLSTSSADQSTQKEASSTSPCWLHQDTPTGSAHYVPLHALRCAVNNKKDRHL